MLKLIAIAAGLVIVAVLGFAASRPDAFHVERSLAMKAPPAEVFMLIDDFQNWSQWSPYEKLDPSMNRQYSGAARGKGAVYQWEGNSKVGEGRMEIMEADKPSKVLILLDLRRPLKSRNMSKFVIEPQGDMTMVTWSMQGSQPFMAKVMGLLFDMDGRIGQDFESGLVNLKIVAEQSS
ncbi:SRPBCC family protein [Govanella unica]|uniref:SRPBCC family protein n=1 Tax=Govanella unica TaxID=2975056 RepID=A0A9X3Z7T4_9PROT|nr:SRPBCC family protein [Govania unica]MDA5194329.1 SRPBCC family protein [Govania unica]